MPEYVIEDGAFVFTANDAKMIVRSPRLDRSGRLWAAVEILEPSGVGYLGTDQGDLGSDRFRSQLAKTVARRASNDSYGFDRLLLDAYLALRADPALSVAYLPPAFQPVPTFLENLPAEREEVVEGLLHKGGLYMLAARPKTGKSLALLNLGLSVVHGNHWLGRRVSQGRVLYFLLEDSPSTFRTRMEAMVPDGTTGDFLVHSGAFKLAEDNYLATVSSCLEATMLIVDPVIQTTDIKDWNSASDVRSGLDLWRRVARDIDAPVVLAAHHRKAEGEHGDQVSGSTQALATVDGVIEMTRDRSALSQNQRRVSFTGRDWPDIPDEVIELDPESLTWGFRGDLETVKQTRQTDRTQTVLECLPALSPGITRSRIQEVTGLSEKAISEAIKALGNQIVDEPRTGKGGGSRYYKPCNQTTSSSLI